jgi:hypothetical protein
MEMTSLSAQKRPSLLLARSITPVFESIRQNLILTVIFANRAEKIISEALTSDQSSLRRKSQMLKAFINWLTVSGAIVIAVILITVVIGAFWLLGFVFTTGVHTISGTKYLRDVGIPASSQIGTKPDLPFSEVP